MKTRTTLLIAASLLASLTLQAEPENGERKGPRGEKPHRAPSAEIIAEFDTDGDGKLTGDEREAAKAARKAKREERRAAMLEEFDADGDGKLNREEKKAAMLARFDADGDGELSKDERQAMREARKRMDRGPRGEGKKRKGPRGERRERHSEES